MTKQIKDIIDLLETLVAYMHDDELPGCFDEEDVRTIYLAIKLLRDSVPLSVIEKIKAKIKEPIPRKQICDDYGNIHGYTNMNPREYQEHLLSIIDQAIKECDT